MMSLEFGSNAHVGNMLGCGSDRGVDGLPYVMAMLDEELTPLLGIWPQESQSQAFVISPPPFGSARRREWKNRMLSEGGIFGEEDIVNSVSGR